jgi:hypothetical protein
MTRRFLHQPRITRLKENVERQKYPSDSGPMKKDEG